MHYGEDILRESDFDLESWAFAFSTLWKDIVSLKDPMGDDWFKFEIVLKDGNGFWIENSNLCILFPRLFSLVVNKEAKVSNMRAREFDTWRWIWSWRWKLFVWEENLLDQLLTLVSTFVVSDEVYKWSWEPDASGVFTVNLSFEILEERFVVDGFQSLMEEKVFGYLWKI